MQLLNAHELQGSSIVANCEMNRERRLIGSNSYARDLNLDILAFLENCKSSPPISWIDLCCGTGRALIEAASEFEKTDAGERVQIEGVDLAGLFHPNPLPHLLSLRNGSIESWKPARAHSLVTCAHGLHYIGDKLAAIAKAVGSLTPDGLFVANLDLANFRNADGKPAGRTIAARIRKNGLMYDTRHRLISCTGPRHVDFGLRYLGANDQAGPNYTGQPAVDSHYSA